METVKSFFDSFKEFIWDIIGYLLPGSFVLILFYCVVSEKFTNCITLDKNLNDYFPFFFLTMSYLIGYVIYGLGYLKERKLGRFSYIKKIEEEISTRPAFLYSKEILINELTERGLSDKYSVSSVRDFRNLVMSFIPESDQKIYTFTFRSDLANHTGNISIVFGFLGVIFASIPCLRDVFFKSDSGHIVLYILLTISYLFLRETRNRFYHVSIGLPFSIFTSKTMKNVI